MEHTATGLPVAARPLSPADFGIGGFAAAPGLPPIPSVLAEDASESTLGAADLMTLRAVRGLVAQAWTDFAGATDPAAKRGAGTELIHAISYLTGFLDGQGIGGGAAPGDGFTRLFGRSSPPTPEAAAKQLLAILSGMVDPTPTRKPNPKKAAENLEGDALLLLGATVMGAAIAALLTNPF